MTKVVIYTLYSVICRPVPKQRYLQCGIYRDPCRSWLSTPRGYLHTTLVQTNQNGHMAAFLDAGVPCLSVLPETCLPIPAFGCNSIALNESLLSGLQLPKSSVVNWR